jgi:RHS repeat-associated protein
VWNAVARRLLERCVASIVVLAMWVLVPPRPVQAQQPTRTAPAPAKRGTVSPLFCLPDDPDCPSDQSPPQVTITPGSGTVPLGPLSVTIDWCDDSSLAPAGPSITFDGQSVTGSFTYVTSAKAGCGAHARSTGTVNITAGSHTLRAAISDKRSNVGVATATYTPPDSIARAVAVTPKNGTDSTTMWSTGSYDFTVHNTGTIAAIYNFTASCTGVTSPCVRTPTADTLAPGQYDTVRVTYTTAADGTPTRLALTATDAADGAVRDSGWVTATVHTPCSDGTATVTCAAGATALINRSGLSVHFGIRNDFNEEQSFNATITCTGAVVSCSLNPNLIVHTMGYQRVPRGQTTIVTVYYATDTLPGTGVIYLVTSGENGTIGGKTTVTVSLPPKTPAPQLFAITPHFATRQLDPGQATTQRVQLQSRGTDTATYLVAVACTAHGALAGGCTPARDTVLLQPEVATTLAVSFTAGTTPGRSDTLTLRAWQASDTLVRDSSTIALAVVRDSAVVDVASVNPGDLRDPSLCLHVAVAPGVSYACGDARLAYALPSTRTRNQMRTPVLLYDSRLAAPYVVVAANVTPPNDGRVLQAVTARLLDSTGAKLDSARWAGSNWVPGTTRRIALLFDPVATRNYPEGAHRYALEVTRSYADSTTARDTVTGTFVVVRRDHSQFGHGWWLAGLEHVHANPGKTTLFWTDGDGSARVYTRDGTSAVWHAPNVDRPDSIVQLGDRYVRYLPHGARVQFDTTHGCHLETITRLADTTRFHYADAAGCGQLDTLTLPPASAGKKYVFTYANPSPGVWWLARVDAPPVNGQARAVTLARNSAGQLTTLVNPVGDTLHFALRASYDDRITRWVDERGDTTVLTYATTTPGPVAQIAVPIAPDTVAVTGFTPAATRGLQGSAAVALDAVYTKVDGPRTDVGDSTLVWLDRFGAPGRLRNALGDETLITRDATWPALAAQVRSPTGALAGARYDDHGNVLADSSTVALDPVVYATTHYTWDRRWDFVATITRPEGDVVSMTYDATTGNRLTQEDGDPASRVRFDYYASGAAAGLLERVHYPLGATDSVAYDAMLGNLAATVSATGDTVLYVRDGIGRDSLVLQRSDSTAGFRVSQYVKDLLDQDILIVDSAGAQALHVRQHFDPAGNLDTLTRWSTPDPNQIGTVTRVFAYDRANRKIRETPLIPSDATSACGVTVQPITWTYDLAGNLIAGGPRPTTNTYDALNRLIRAAGSDTATYAYDAMGHMLAANNAAARISRTYYLNGFLRADTLRIATAVLSDSNFQQHVYGLGYGYDLDGRRVWMAAGEGDTTHYAYDPQSGLLASITDPFGNRFNYHYDARRRLVVLARMAQQADSITETYRYDADSRLIARSIYSPGVGQRIHDDSLLYDRAGRVIANPKTGDVLTYSPLGALTHTAYTDPNASPELFTTDALGNKVSTITYGTAYSRSDYQYVKGSDRLNLASHPPTSPGDTTYYCEDGHGAVTRELTGHPLSIINGLAVIETHDTRNTYNIQHQLIQSAFTFDTVPHQHPTSVAFHTTETYRYDALGRRVWVRMVRDTTPNCTRINGCPNEFTRTVWDGSQVLREIRASGDTASAAQESDNTSGTYSGSVTYVNGLGTDAPLELIQGQGGAIQLYTNWRGQFDFGTCGTSGAQCPSTTITFPAASASSYGAFGTAPGSALRWHGTVIIGLADGSGYQYRRNRYYDASTGRFTQEDPIGLAGGLNAYGYANGDPINYSDPFGLKPCPPDNDCGPGEWGPIVGAGCPAISDACNAAPLIPKSGKEALVKTGVVVGAAALGVAGAAVLDAAGGTGAASEMVAPTEGQVGQITRQLAQYGRRSVEKSVRTWERRLTEHLTKLEDIQARGGDPGSVEREIRNFRGLIEAAKRVLGGPQ